MKHEEAEWRKSLSPLSPKGEANLGWTLLTSAHDVFIGATTQSIARHWLIPRLQKLTMRHPGLVGAIHTSNSSESDWSGDVYVGVRHGTGKWPATAATSLGDEVEFAVASRSLLSRYARWQDAPFIQSPYQNWRAWFKTLNSSVPSHVESGLEVADSSLALDAAMAGHGVALARRRIAQPLVEQKRLVRVSAHEARDQLNYYFVCASGSEKDPRSGRLREWLLHEFDLTKTTRRAK